MCSASSGALAKAVFLVASRPLERLPCTLFCFLHLFLLVTFCRFFFFKYFVVTVFLFHAKAGTCVPGASEDSSSAAGEGGCCSVIAKGNRAALGTVTKGGSDSLRWWLFRRWECVLSCLAL